MATPITSRRLDLLYLIFFITHIPVMFAVDFAGYYPASIRPALTITIRDYYVNTYRDRFFIDPPLWFKGFIFLELIYHVPLSLWAVPALLRGESATRKNESIADLTDDPLIPLQLLVWAMETAITTLTCTLEMLSWEGYSTEEQMRLGGLYIPYLVLAVLMGTDMFLRLKRSLGVKAKTQ